MGPLCAGGAQAPPTPERAPHTLAQGGPTRRRLGRGARRDGHYEVGRLKLPVPLVPELAALFAVPTDVLHA